MLTILNSLNAHNIPIFEPILMILVSKFKVHRVLSEQTYLPLGLLSPLITPKICSVELALEAQRKKCIRKCCLLKLSAANNC